MNEENLFAYDDVAYPSYVYVQSHPDRLATLATLFGMSPAPVENCRVLELGCGAGGNIIPLAFDLVGSSFVGIDLAAKAITQGQEMIRRLELKNISLQHADLMTLGDELGKFDYIIAHGLFSWVPEFVRDRILEICRTHLAQQGVAYISYNTYPGCRLREITRDIMRFHTKHLPDPREKVRQSRAVVNWIAEAQKEQKSYATFLQEINVRIGKRDDSSIYHDDIADINVPFYFNEFARLADEHSLQFLSEADFFDQSSTHNFVEGVSSQLDQIGEKDLLAREQYLDFLTGRSFRQTLICHQEVELSRRIVAARLKGLLIRSELKSVSSTPDIKSEAVEEFRTKNGASASTNQPLAKAAFFCLAQIYPRAITMDQLALEVRILTGERETTIEDDLAMLAQVIIKTFEVGGIGLHMHEPIYAMTPSKFPVASPIARLQLEQGNVVTTLLNTSLRLEDEIAARLLVLLDGRHDHAALTVQLTEVLKSRSIEPNPDSENNQTVAFQLEQKLVELGKLGLLYA